MEKIKDRKNSFKTMFVEQQGIGERNGQSSQDDTQYVMQCMKNIAYMKSVFNDNIIRDEGAKKVLQYLRELCALIEKRIYGDDAERAMIYFKKQKKVRNRKRQ